MEKAKSCSSYHQERRHKIKGGEKKMKKIMLGILMFAIFAVFTVPAVAQEVYFVPQQSNATYCNTTDVEIWANATDFGGGQINLTYDSTCANVTNWVRNTTNFLMGGWSHYDGREWITFSTMDPQPPLLSGKYMVGTLTLHCINDCTEGCETPIAFIEPSTLLDDTGKPVTATRIEGTFRCQTPTSAKTPTPSSGRASILPTKTPTSPILPSQTQNLTPTPIPVHTPTITPSPTATTSPSVSPTPTSTMLPEGKQELSGFGAAFAVLGLLVTSYMILKREKEDDKK